VVKEIEGIWKSTEYEKCSGTFHVLIYPDCAKIQFNTKYGVQNVEMDCREEIIEHPTNPEQKATKWMLRNSKLAVDQQFLVTLTRDTETGDWYYGNYVCLYPTDVGVLQVTAARIHNTTTEEIQLKSEGVTVEPKQSQLIDQNTYWSDLEEDIKHWEQYNPFE
jgi:hypothetical protein